MDKKQLEARLSNWAEEYGGGRYENIGFQSRNVLQTLVEHEGFIPSSRGFIPIPIKSLADEVESTVRAMEAFGYTRPGLVLRCEYFVPNAPMEIRLGRLKRVGVSISRAGYYDYLAIAKAYVAGQLFKRDAA
jgi:hypothetical protein